MRKMDNNLMDINQLIKAEKTEDIVSDLKNIIELSQKQAYQAINTALVYRNWLIGYRIAEEELKGEDRAEYGTTLIRKLSKELTNEYGKGYTKTNLYSFYSFYKISVTNLSNRRFSSNKNSYRKMFYHEKDYLCERLL